MQVAQYQAIWWNRRIPNRKVKALQACNIPRHRIFSMFLTSIKGYNSILICQNLPICNPRTLLHNIDSHTKFEKNPFLFVCLYCCFTSQVNSYGHCGTVSSPNHTFSWAGLNKRLTSNSCTYFRLYLTTTLLEWISGREENDRRNHDQSPRKYGTGPGSNSRPLDLQSETHL